MDSLVRVGSDDEDALDEYAEMDTGAICSSFLVITVFARLYRFEVYGTASNELRTELCLNGRMLEYSFFCTCSYTSITKNHKVATCTSREV